MIMKLSISSLMRICTVIFLYPVLGLTAILEDLTPYSIDMHLHGFSNHNAGQNPASMEFHSEQAVLTKYAEILWWTDHTRAFDQWRPFAFDMNIANIEDGSLNIVGLPPVRTSLATFLEAKLSGGTPSARIESGSAIITLRSDQSASDFQFLSYEAKDSRHRLGSIASFRFNRPLFSEPFVDADLECNNLSIDAICEVEFALSWHYDGDTLVQQAITYRIDSRVTKREVSLLAPWHVQVVIPPTTNSRYFFKLLEDASLMKNGDDNTISKFILRAGARAGATSEMIFRGITITSDLPGDTQQIEAVNNLAQRYEKQFGLKEPVGLEFGTGEGHLNAFLPRPMNENDAGLFDVKEGVRQSLNVTDWAARVHNTDGIVSLNHPFGPGTACDLLLPEQCILERAANFLEKKAFGANLIEVGYVSRGLGLREHLNLWDILTSNELLLYGTAASDNHGTQWRRLGTYITWVLSPSANSNDLIGSLKAGRVFFGNPKVWKGTFSFRINDSFMGDRILNPGGTSLLRFILDPWPESVKVYLVQGLIKPSMEVEYLHKQTQLTKGQILEIDTSQPSFVRLEAYDDFELIKDTLNSPGIFTNPIVMLADSSPQVTIPDIKNDSNADGLLDVEAVALHLNPVDPDRDTDGDGISDVIEIGNNILKPLDSDLDGIIDALEPGASSSNASIASNIPLSRGNTVSIKTNEGEILSNVGSSFLDEVISGIVSPFGPVSYITSAPIGRSVTIQIAFSTDLPSELTIYKVNNEGALTELPTGLWERINSRSITLKLTDGDQITDLDAKVNGSIESAVILAASNSLPATNNSNGGGSVYGVFLFLIFYVFRLKKIVCYISLPIDDPRKAPALVRKFQRVYILFCSHYNNVNANL